MKMKMYDIDDYDSFMKLINLCKGNVYVISGEGDRLNLKSKLTQFVALSQLFKSSVIEELELETENDEDAAEIVDFMMHRKKD
ncbi:MAG: polya polymerase [Eubacteriales bacterium]|nr:polya polymerase [Eubacteriales bacterium]